MPHAFFSWLSHQEAGKLALLSVWAFGLIALGFWTVLRFRDSPDVRERKRRIAVNLAGRMGEAMITDLDETTVHYTYQIAGVAYHASQDVSSLQDFLPASPNQSIGHASLKYHPRNPANSIVVCESWSGLRVGHQRLKKELTVL
jgi:hypothetical protein